ncbi:sensor histidine kinase [Oceanirhabdus sp. W0125-5]|uniref:sensor histidine kinase n=1 Tax=Oceanirhabdus sp. W0125-5 TaxID=2999116 RepID=UPI0022F2C0B3|nr:ATP-binding protein [Oceanirhabdus sp. W0125-5]WBW98414.1 ATP-binding protein [Oceanirhabdus sp. W0125-5]
MLEDFCLLSEILINKNIEIFFGFKKGIEDSVIVKKINKNACNEDMISLMKKEFFSQSPIETFENQDKLIHIEKNVNSENDMILNAITSNEDGIIFFKGTKLIHCNKAFYHMMNISYDMIKFDALEDNLVIKTIVKNINTMESDRCNSITMNNLFHLDDELKSFTFEITKINKDNNIMVLCKDKTKERITNKKLVSVNQRLNAVIESSNSGIFEIDDRELKNIWISYDIYNLLGYKSFSSEITKERVIEVIYEEDGIDLVEKFNDSVLNNRIISKEIRIMDYEGNYKWFSLVAYAIHEKINGKFKLVGSITDIHDKKIASMNLLNSEKALREERELNKLTTEFFNNISHDFKTPLNLITNSLKLLRNSFSEILEIDKQGMRYFEIIQQNCYRLIKLVNDILDLSRIDSGFYSLSLYNGNIVNVIEDVTMSVKEYTKNKGIELVFDTEFEEEYICFDNEKIERIMLNLLSNAIKFTGDGGVILVAVSKEDDMVSVMIKDTGIGIPKNKLKTIFERFEQAHEISSRLSGTGIGLALVKSLIEMHEGNIEIKSVEGDGTEIKFYLPIKTVDKDESKEFMESKFDIDKVFVELSDL